MARPPPFCVNVYCINKIIKQFLITLFLTLFHSKKYYWYSQDRDIHFKVSFIMRMKSEVSDGDLVSHLLLLRQSK